MQYFIDHRTGTIIKLGDEHVAVIVDVPEGSYSDSYFLEGDYADDTRASVTPLPLQDEYQPGPKIAGFMDIQEDVVLPAAAVWYVRAMVNRGLQALEDSIAECANEAVKAAGNPDVPSWAVDSLHGAVSYNKQMLDEARRYIPTSFQ